MRLELMTPAGDLVLAESYNKLFTLHGAVMVFFFLVPAIPTTLGNFLVPLMIGARDMAFPRLNLASWYVFIGGSLFAVASLLAGGVDTGWTFYTPYSTTYTNSAVVAMALGIFIAGFSSIFTGLNIIVTRRWAATRSCSNTCSGSIRTLPSISWCCRPLPWSANWSAVLAAARPLAIVLLPSPAWRLPF
jgi:heme/copper-type cytochrome/quinol oxidase subunit 1